MDNIYDLTFPWLLMCVFVIYKGTTNYFLLLLQKSCTVPLEISHY